MKKTIGIGCLFAVLLFLISFSKLSISLSASCAVIGAVIFSGGITIYNAMNKDN